METSIRGLPGAVPRRNCGQEQVANPACARSTFRYGIMIVNFLEKFSCARGDTHGSDSIESTYRKQNRTSGIRQDAVLVSNEARPFCPDRDVPRKTEIDGTGIRSPSRKKPEMSDRVDDAD